MGPNCIFKFAQVSAQRYVLTGEARHPVESLADLQAALKTGDEQKRRAATAMNERSSRAHSLFILSLRMSRDSVAAAGGGGESVVVVVTSQLFLVDLGGSKPARPLKAVALRQLINTRT